jgi:hypothetical protein
MTVALLCISHSKIKGEWTDFSKNAGNLRREVSLADIRSRDGSAVATIQVAVGFPYEVSEDPH